MERRIEIKRQDEESPDTLELVERLSGLKNVNSVNYAPAGKNSKSGTLILEGENYDLQEVYHILSSAGYTVKSHVIIENPDETLESRLGGQR